MTTPDLDHIGGHPGDGPGDDRLVTQIRVAEVAAAAARSTPGVAHLQQGLWGLVQQLGAEAWTRVTGRPRPDTAGTEVAVRVDPVTGAVTVTVDVMLVVDGRRPAAVVAGDVQRRIGGAVYAAFGVAPGRVSVHITDVAVPG
ncbi:MAG: hypothetical protein J0I34_06915 [Pseudonocardia sp.]|uniref:hypothetical protein n=1 Tax=unclassified Pseudonocardia TaxID=2619320 RepID=UPI001AD18488|nr:MULTISPECIES: hypothetical protein [unclassified Pseudonocardia]MBN9108496.1 hypothetical protein [Pseudonocardia sp.]